MDRLVGYSPVGSVSVGPQDREVLVGSFSMKEGDDTIWVRVKQADPPDVWTYSYGLLTWRTDKGQELGTVKIYGDVDSEVFRLGVGLPPDLKDGALYFTPRAFNRRWIDLTLPPIWTLDFEAQSGTSGGGAGGDFGFSASLVSFGDFVDARVTYALRDKFARIVLTPNQ